MAEAPVPGTALVTRRAIREIVRRAAAASYGVVAVGRQGPATWLRRVLGLGTPGVTVNLDGGLRAEVSLTIAYGVPVAAVARNVEATVRHEVRLALGRELDELIIHVDRLRPNRVKDGG